MKTERACCFRKPCKIICSMNLIWKKLHIFNASHLFLMTNGSRIGNPNHRIGRLRALTMHRNVITPPKILEYQNMTIWNKLDILLISYLASQLPWNSFHVSNSFLLKYAKSISWTLYANFHLTRACDSPFLLHLFNI